MKQVKDQAFSYWAVECGGGFLTQGEISAKDLRQEHGNLFKKLNMEVFPAVCFQLLTPVKMQMADT